MDLRPDWIRSCPLVFRHTASWLAVSPRTNRHPETGAGDLDQERVESAALWASGAACAPGFSSTKPRRRLEPGDSAPAHAIACAAGLRQMPGKPQGQGDEGAYRVRR